MWGMFREVGSPLHDGQLGAVIGRSYDCAIVLWSVVGVEWRGSPHLP